MKILSIEKDPCRYLPYYTSAPRGGKPKRGLLAFFKGKAILPAPLSCVVMTSDLQGRESIGGRLLGQAVADAIWEGAVAGTWLRPERAFLCGDLYDVPHCDKRGASGPVDLVWDAFAQRCGASRVVGVHGNHDWLDGEPALPGNAIILDGTIWEYQGLRVGGVGGIIGKTSKNQRRSQDDFLAALTAVLDQSPYVVLLHQGPDAPGQQGDPDVRALLEAGHTGLTVFGHSHWANDWLIDLGEGQAINVDGRVVILEAEQSQ